MKKNIKTTYILNEAEYYELIVCLENAKSEIKLNATGKEWENLTFLKIQRCESILKGEPSIIIKMS